MFIIIIVIKIRRITAIIFKLIKKKMKRERNPRAYIFYLK